MCELLTFQNVSVAFHKNTVVHQVNFSLKPGEILGIVGESGSGKSTILKAAMGILENGGRVTEGKILFQGRNFCEMKEKELRTIRGAGIGMIFQDAGASLSPHSYHRRTDYTKVCRHIRRFPDRRRFKRLWGFSKSYIFRMGSGSGTALPSSCPAV